MKIQVALCTPGIPLLREVGDRRVHGARWPANLPELAKWKIMSQKLGWRAGEMDLSDKGLKTQVWIPSTHVKTWHSYVHLCGANAGWTVSSRLRATLSHKTRWKALDKDNLHPNHTLPHPFTIWKRTSTFHPYSSTHARCDPPECQNRTLFMRSFYKEVLRKLDQGGSSRFRIEVLSNASSRLSKWSKSVGEASHPWCPLPYVKGSKCH